MMFFYEEANDIDDQVKVIREDLNCSLKSQEQHLNVLLSCLNKLNSTVQDTDYIQNPQEIMGLLSDLKKNLDFTRKNISNIKKLMDFIPSDDSCNANIDTDKYNELATLYNDIIHKTSQDFNKCISKYIQHTYCIIDGMPMSDSVEFSANCDNVQDSFNDDVENNNINELADNQEEIPDNNTLTISEIQEKIFLPYTANEVIFLLSENKKYSTFQDVIDNEFILPISKYKNSTISRFKEAYSLMRKREKVSVKESLELAVEMSFNSSLNPAIITACKSLNELDSYLDCMDSNQLDKFKCFDIKYEALPAKINKI